MPGHCRCCVPRCNSLRRNCPKLSFHRIPVNKALARNWLHQINNPKLSHTNLQNVRVCGKHFKKDQYKHFNKKILKEGIIPVLFLPETTIKTKPACMKINTTNNLVGTSFSVVHNSLEKKLFSPNKSVENTNISSEQTVDFSIENANNSSEPIIDSNPRKTYDFKKTCRICLLEKENLQNIESDFIQNMFQSCDVLKFSENDKFPKRICALCISELKIVHHFSRKCGKSTDISQQYTESLNITHAQANINMNCDEIQGFSKTVEISYMPSETRNYSLQNTERLYKYSLVSENDIQKSEILSSVTNRETSLAGVAEICPTETEKTSCLGNNCIIENNSAVANNKVEEKNPTTCNTVGNTEPNKRVLRKRKINQNTVLPTIKTRNIALEAIEKDKLAPTLNDTVLISEQIKDKNQNLEVREEKLENSGSIMNLSHAVANSEVDLRSSKDKLAKNKSRRARRRPRTFESRSRTARRRAMRKKIELDNGDAIYWYDKQSAANQINTESNISLLNSTESTQICDKAFIDELPGFSNYSQDIVNDLNSITSSETSTNIKRDVKTVSTDIIPHLGTNKTPVCEYINAFDTLLLEKSEEKNEKPAEICEKQQRNTRKQAENNSVRKRGPGRPRKIKRKRTVNLKTGLCNSSEPNITNTAISESKVGNNANENDNTVAGITESENIIKCCIENGDSVQRRNEYEYSSKTDSTSAPNTDKSSTSAPNTAKSSTSALITAKSRSKTASTCAPVIAKSSTETVSTSAPITAKSRTKTASTSAPVTVKSSTSALITVKSRTITASTSAPNTTKYSTETASTSAPVTVKSSTSKYNIQNSNNVKHRTRTNTTKRITRSGNTARNVTKGNKTVSEEKPDSNSSLFLPKIDRTASQVLPTKEKDSSHCNDYQQNTDKITKQHEATSNMVQNDSIPNDFMQLRHRNVKLSLYSLNKNVKQSVYSQNENIEFNLNSQNKNIAFNLNCQNKNIEFNLNCQNKNVLLNKLNIKHLNISKKELNKLFSVKLELNKITIKNNTNQSNSIINKISINKVSIENKKIRILNKPMVKNYRQLRSSKRNSSLNGQKQRALTSTCCNIETVKLTKDIVIKNVQLDTSVVDKDIKTVNNTCELVKIVDSTLNIPQKEEINSTCDKPELICSENSVKHDTCSVNDKIEQVACSENDKINVEACLKNRNTEAICSDTAKLDANTCSLNSVTEHNTSMENTENAEHDTCLPNMTPCSEDVQTEHIKCSPDTTTKHDTPSPESETENETCSPNTEIEQDECSLNSETAYDVCSQESEAGNEHDYCSPNKTAEHDYRSPNKTAEHDYCSPNKTAEHDYCSPNKTAEHDYCSPNKKAEHTVCSPNKTDYVNSPPKNKIEHVESLTNTTTEYDTCSPNNMNTLKNKTVTDDVDDEEGNVTKNQLKELLTEFVVFPNKNCDLSTVEEQTNTEQDSPTKYYKVLDPTTNELMVQDHIHIINSDAMLSNGLLDSPQLTANIPTVYDEMSLNDSFEKTLNNIFNTEYNTVCDGQIVGADILRINDVSAEEVVTTVANKNEPNLYQLYGDTSPCLNMDEESVYFNKSGGLIVTCDNEYSSTRFHNAWVPIVPAKSPVDSAIKIIDNFIIQSGQEIPSDNSDNILNCIDMSVPTQEYETSTVASEENSLDVYKVGDTAYGKEQYGNEFCCEYCGCVFNDLDSFIIHQQSVHICSGLYKCGLCKMQFDTKLSLNKHMTVHTDVEQNQCQHCERKFKETHSLIVHLANANCLTKEKYKCMICNESFSAKVKYMKHLTVHKQYICYICNEAFNSKEYCRQHLRMHCQKEEV